MIIPVGQVKRKRSAEKAEPAYAQAGNAKGRDAGDRFN